MQYKFSLVRMNKFPEEIVTDERTLSSYSLPIFATFKISPVSEETTSTSALWFMRKIMPFPAVGEERHLYFPGKASFHSTLADIGSTPVSYTHLTLPTNREV